MEIFFVVKDTSTNQHKNYMKTGFSLTRRAVTVTPSHN